MSIELKDVSLAEKPAVASESSPEKTEPVATPAEPIEEPKEPEETEETEQPAKVEEVKEKTPEKPLANKTNERIRNLANENRELKAKLEAFTKQPAPQLDDEMTVDDLNQLVNERAIQAASLLAESKQVETEFKNQVAKWAEDFEQVKANNPALDPESPDYDVELDTTLARLLDDGHGNPRTDILVSDILKTLNKRETNATSKAKEDGKSEATARLAKQMAEGAITPTTKPSKTEEITDEELAEMRVNNPQKYMKIIDRL